MAAKCASRSLKMFLKYFSNEGFLLDSNYAKIIFEKQEQSALAYAVEK